MDGPLELLTASPEETRAVGEAIAAILRPGDVVSLTGDLGAGKTTLVQGAARALGVDRAVLSPTFTLVREYQGTSDVHVYHLDVYRLDRMQEVLDLGFEEMLEEGGVVFIEWGDVIEGLLPDSFLQVELSASDDSARRIVLSSRGPAWAARWGHVAEAMTAWSP
jgi:tRNA threonylcarbamoyladenosine biosynthesis protein TsaE